MDEVKNIVFFFFLLNEQHCLMNSVHRLRETDAEGELTGDF